MSGFKYVNHYCYYSRIKELLLLSQEEWLSEMIGNFHKVFPGKPSSQQIRAWKDMFDPFIKQLSALPDGYKDLDIIFEYVLPKQNMISDKSALYTYVGDRPDVIILSSKTVLILEFKEKKGYPIWSQRQARKYKNRIQYFHDESYGMNKKDIMVTFGDYSLQNGIHKVFVCGINSLKDAIIELFENNPQPHENALTWINSDYSIHKSKERQIARRIQKQDTK